MRQFSFPLHFLTHSLSPQWLILLHDLFPSDPPFLPCFKFSTIQNTRRIEDVANTYARLVAYEQGFSHSEIVCMEISASRDLFPSLDVYSYHAPTYTYIYTEIRQHVRKPHKTDTKRRQSERERDVLHLLSAQVNPTLGSQSTEKKRKGNYRS